MSAARSAKQIIVSNDTVQLLNKLAARQSPLNLSDGYEVYVRNVSGQKPDSVDTGYSQASNSAYPVNWVPRSSSTGEQYLAPVQDTDEIHDLIRRIDDTVSMMETKQQMMKPYGGVPYKPIASHVRNNIHDMVEQGNLILDDMHELKLTRSPQEAIDPAREADLKSILIQLKKKLMEKLSPNERAYYDRVDQSAIKGEMGHIEDRIDRTMEKLNENQRVIDRLAKQAEKAPPLAAQSTASSGRVIYY